MVSYEWNDTLCRRYTKGMRPLVKYDHARWAQRIAKRLGDRPEPPTIVDVASGPGFLLLELGKLLPGANLVAQDEAAPMVTIAREEAWRAKQKLETVCCPAERINLGDSSADVVTCKQLLHEVADPARVIGEMARLLKPGGRLFLIDFDADGSRPMAIAVRAFMWFVSGTEVSRDFWRSHSAARRGAEVRDLVQQAGLHDVTYDPVGFNFLITAAR